MLMCANFLYRKQKQSVNQLSFCSFYLQMPIGITGRHILYFCDKLICYSSCMSYMYFLSFLLCYWYEFFHVVVVVLICFNSCDTRQLNKIFVKVIAHLLLVFLRGQTICEAGSWRWMELFFDNLFKYIT